MLKQDNNVYDKNKNMDPKLVQIKYTNFLSCFMTQKTYLKIKIDFLKHKIATNI